MGKPPIGNWDPPTRRALNERVPSLSFDDSTAVNPFVKQVRLTYNAVLNFGITWQANA